MSTLAQDSPARVSTEASVGSRPAAHSEALTKVYGDGEARVVALDGVSVEFQPGQFTAVMGPQGPGSRP